MEHCLKSVHSISNYILVMKIHLPRRRQCLLFKQQFKAHSDLLLVCTGLFIIIDSILCYTGSFYCATGQKKMRWARWPLGKVLCHLLKHFAYLLEGLLLSRCFFYLLPLFLLWQFPLPFSQTVNHFPDIDYLLLGLFHLCHQLSFKHWCIFSVTFGYLQAPK